MNNKINDEAHVELDQINVEKSKEPTNRFKSSKNDPVFDFLSDVLKNVPEILFKQLALVL